MRYIGQIAELSELLENTDHIDVKVVEGEVSLREFVASMLSYNPKWLELLFRIRNTFSRLVGMAQEDSSRPNLTPEDVPMTLGATILFFTLSMVKEEQYWIAQLSDDKYMHAHLGVVVEPLSSNLKRFHVMSVIRYKHWIGRFYFNISRPFHHLVVKKTAQAGVRH